jgi:hypothetical protein
LVGVEELFFSPPVVLQEAPVWPLLLLVLQQLELEK